MSQLSSSPRFLKGAIISGPRVIPFQYNPATLSRSVRAASPGGSEMASTAEAMRLKGPPMETISLEIELDATDQLAAGDPIAATLGIGPQLAALEILLYPPSPLVIGNEVLARLGLIEVVPVSAPLCLFVWGPSRILPVRINDLQITEEMFDSLLNPIQARVSLSLTVLTYQDLGLASTGGALFLGQQIVKEAMAALATATTLAGGLVPRADGSF